MVDTFPDLYVVRHYDEKIKGWWYQYPNGAWGTNVDAAAKRQFSEAQRYRDAVDVRLSAELKVIRNTHKSK